MSRCPYRAHEGEGVVGDARVLERPAYGALLPARDLHCVPAVDKAKGETEHVLRGAAAGLLYRLKDACHGTGRLTDFLWFRWSCARLGRFPRCMNSTTTSRTHFRPTRAARLVAAFVATLAAALCMTALAGASPAAA